MRADVLDYVGFFFDFQNSFIPNYLAQRNPCIPFRLFQGYTPADCFMLRARSLTLDSALPKIWLRFTIFAKLFHSIQFLTIRQSQLRIRRRPLTAANKSKTEPFGIYFTHGCNAFFTAWGIRPHFIRASYLGRSLTTSLYTRKLGRFLV